MSQAIDFKCPQCGGAIVFNAQTGAMTCANCGTSYDPRQFGAAWPDQASGGPGSPGGGTPPFPPPPPPDAIPAQDPSSWQAQPTSSSGAPFGDLPGMAEYTCNSCGATVVTSATESAGTCPYCRSPIVIVQQTSGALTPDMVIPFRWTRDQAVESLQRLYRGKRLLPKVFSSQNFVDEVKGVYVPFWLYDFDADVNERYNASTVSTRYAGSRRYITTRNYVAIRQGNVKFMAIPVDGSANMPDAIMESIEPFDVSQAVPFQGSYLAGFMAERYDVDSQTAGGRAHERAVRSAGQIFARSVTGYRSVTPAGAQVTVKSAVVHYVLFPVWMLTTIWRGERFTFAMNGQTGRMVGDLPLDRKAYWRWFWLLAGSCGVAAGLISSLAVVLL